MTFRPTPTVAALRGLRRAVAGADYPGVRVPAGPRLSRFLPAAGLLALLGLLAITAQYLVDTRKLPALVAWLLALLTVAPLPLLARGPLWAWRVAMLGLFFGTFNALDDESFPWSTPQIIVTLVVLVVVALRVDRAVLVWVGVLTMLPVWMLMGGSGRVGVALFLAALLIVAGAFRRVRQVEGELAEQTEVTEREQARRALLEERARIARELHDVVAHHMSLLAVRAETAPYRLTDVAEPTREEFAALAQAARDALTDLRRLLGVLRSEAAEPVLAPQPDLDAVADLVDAAQRAGMEVHYLPPITDPDRRPPDPVSLAGYRIVQEALANATRHAPGAPVTVQVWPGPRELAVRVHNTAPPGGSGGADHTGGSGDSVGAGRSGDSVGAGGSGDSVGAGGAGDGLGLIGMRERATALGGDFSAGPTPDGGFSVIATLPYDGDPRQPEGAA